MPAPWASWLFPDRPARLGQLTAPPSQALDCRLPFSCNGRPGQALGGLEHGCTLCSTARTARQPGQRPTRAAADTAATAACRLRPRSRYPAQLERRRAQQAAPWTMAPRRGSGRTRRTSGSRPSPSLAATSTRMRPTCTKRRPTSSSWPSSVRAGGGGGGGGAGVPPRGPSGCQPAVRSSSVERGHPACCASKRQPPPAWRTARLPAGNDAGETFTKLADVHLKLESKHDAAGAWVEAAKAYLKSDQRRAWWWPAVVVASCFRPLSLHPAPLSRWRSSSAGRRQAACDMQRASCASASCHLLLATPAPCRSGGVLATGSGAVH